MALLEIEQLCLSYGGAVALQSVSLTLNEGSLIGILGPNGAGKSSLLKAISRSHPSTGILRFKGRSLHDLAVHETVAAGICHCPEGRRLFPELSVKKNLELGAYLQSSGIEIARIMEDVFALFPKLAERLDQRAGTMSGGEQQMLAIGRALMGCPALLLLDEPSVGIAHRLKGEIFEAIQRIAATGTAVLMVEQDAVNTLQIAQHVVVLESGRVACSGAPSSLSDDIDVRRLYLGL